MNQTCTSKPNDIITQHKHKTKASFGHAVGRPAWKRMGPILTALGPAWDNSKCTVISISSCLGGPAFAAAGPRLWNSLPTHVRQLDLSLGHFLPETKNVFNC